MLRRATLCLRAGWLGRAAWVCLLALAGIAPSPVRADASCDGFFANLRAAAQKSSGSYIHTLWTTNYFVPARNARFMATTELQLRPQNGDLFGAGTRNQISYSTNDRQAPQTDAVSIRLRADGKIMFNDKYGPYDPKCAHDKFAIVDSADSIEMFTFKPGTDAPRVAGDRATVAEAPPTPAASPTNTGPRVVEAWEPVQWQVGFTDTVKGSEEYGLFNTRRHQLNLSSQLGMNMNGRRLDWAGTSGGYMIFFRPDKNDVRELTDLDVVAIYNTKIKFYLKGRFGEISARSSKDPSYEWRILKRSGSEFAIFNINANDYVVLDEEGLSGARPHNDLTYLNCAQQYHTASCSKTFKRPLP